MVLYQGDCEHYYPNRGTDDDADFEEWEMYELRERVKLVQEFDKLADDMVRTAVRLTKEYVVREEEYFVPQTRKVLIPILSEQ